MSRSQLTDEQFREELTSLLGRARRNDVSVEGGWECVMPDDDTRRWDVQITIANYGGEE